MVNLGTEHAVRDGSQVLHFAGDVLAVANSRRPNAERWSEIAVYRMKGGGYLVSKIGYSTVTHDPECSRVRKDMPEWANASEERALPRSACAECRPDLIEMSPHLRVEKTKHRAVVAHDAALVIDVLLDGRDHPPPLVARVLDLAAESDDGIKRAWS